VEAICACIAPDGYGYIAGWDCDDTDPAIHQGVADSCDGIDSDCDRLDCGVDVATTRFERAGRDYGDGDRVAAAGDADGDGVDDLWIGGYYDDGAASTSGVVYLEPVTAQGEVPLRRAATMVQGETSGAAFGWAFAAASDLSGDGVPDLVVGEPFAWSGRIYVFNGPFEGRMTVRDAVTVVEGVREGEMAGLAVALMGENNGVDSITVGAPYRDSRYWDSGVAYVLPTTGTGSGSMADATAILTGGADFLNAGSSVLGPGDLDGDGLADVVVGTTGSGGTVYIVRSPLLGTIALADADEEWQGAWARSPHGPVGDIDGDGLTDFTAKGAETSGIYILGYTHSGIADAASESFAHYATLGDYSGAAAIADMDGDGADDLAVGGTPAVVTATAGGVIIFSPVRTGSWTEDDAALVMVGTGWSYAGDDLASLGDIDDDGKDDLIVGSDGNGAWLLHGADAFPSP
jgi:hypothetical protein